MEHPLITDIEDLSIDDLQNKISELNKKLSMAYRLGNHEVVHQIRMAIETFQNRYNQKLQENTKPGQDFSDKIDIS